MKQMYFSLIVWVNWDSVLIEKKNLIYIFRGRNTPNVSKSVGVLDFSANGKSSSAKPPRRLSNPVKASPTPSPKAVANITPISETRSRKSGNGQGPQTRVQTPVSDIFRSTARKFSLLSSASYWLNQIKLSESAAKHSISLGFFKLALEAGCEVKHNHQFIYVFFNCLLF